MIDSTLLLNADGTPLSLVPLSTCSWQKAIGLLYTGQCEALHHYDHWVVHSPSTEIMVPSVCILKKQITVKLRPRRLDAGPRAELVFLRDGYQCQYCRGHFPVNLLTIDHVLPRKFGGKTTWKNSSSCCSPCNGRRGHDVRIRPMTEPFIPTTSHLIKMRKKFPLSIPHPTWNYYLGWKEELVRIISPSSKKNPLLFENNFDSECIKAV